MPDGIETLKKVLPDIDLDAPVTVTLTLDQAIVISVALDAETQRLRAHGEDASRVIAANGRIEQAALEQVITKLDPNKVRSMIGDAIGYLSNNPHRH